MRVSSNARHKSLRGCSVRRPDRPLPPLFFMVNPPFRGPPLRICVIDETAARGLAG
ncbi:hypothetical protein CBM2623_A10008 [Cupriavidus taiwanensis]|nr:hypothetical protein CBM2591_A10007 [Cupriavidus taiwanensis]SPA25274.1 hypothetical protein CBM2623_A10008 [Cupriavidus taiwanensis]SPD44973.1 protein of unknown function [Cupriavidus taiwanensis]